MKTMTAFRAAIEAAPIVPVLTVYDADHAEPLAEALIKGGMTSVEITLRTPAALDVIRRMGEAEKDLLIGAGTIISEGDVDAALKAGSDFLVTPGTSPLLLDALASRRHHPAGRFRGTRRARQDAGCPLRTRTQSAVFWHLLRHADVGDRGSAAHGWH